MKVPTKIAAAFLVLVLALSTPAISEMIKISNLLTHFQKHNSKEALSFLDFLKGHYAGEDGTDKDAAEDKELPFLSGTLNSLTPFSVPETAGIIQGFYCLPCIHPVVPGKYYLPDPHLSRIWQPPRYC